MTYQEAKTELARRLNVDYEDIRAGTVDLFKWADLDSWVNLAIHRAWDYHDWAFTVKTYTTTSTADATDMREAYDYPQDFVSDSIKLLAVKDDEGDMEVYEPINCEDFTKLLMDDDENDELVWASEGRYYFINQNAYDNVAGRTIEIKGKLRCDNLSASDSLLPFSPDTDNEENSGNEAVVKLAYAIALSSDKMKRKNDAVVEEKEAYGMLELLASKEKQLQATYKLKNRPQWQVGQMF